MPTNTLPSPGKLAATIAVTSRHHPDRDLSDLYRQLHAAAVKAYAAKQLAKFPVTLTEDQISEIAAVLRGGNPR